MVLTNNINYFDDEPCPESHAQLVGYAWLINTYQLHQPAPRNISIIVPPQNTKKTNGRWLIWGSKYQPSNNWFAHLTFALKYEGVELATMKNLFTFLDSHEVAQAISERITGAYSRRIWFFYEWLTTKKLPLKDASTGNYVDALDEKLQFGCTNEKSKRHRVNNNLPGVRGFCPLIKKTTKLTTLIAAQLNKKAAQNINDVPQDILMRAAAFLLLSDSKASYIIEGESPAHNRLQSWGKIIGQAGKQKLTINEIERLQQIVIPDKRFIVKGIRCIHGFIGEHDRTTNIPIPEHISAKPEDLDQLLADYLSSYEKMKTAQFHPVLMATVIAFAFVFIHPLEDGNGRIHRYLIHHVLADTNFTAKGLIFPVSTVMANNVEQYKAVLEQFTKPRLKYIQWQPTTSHNVHVTNETIDLYSYGDYTTQAEYLFECVKETIDSVLPEEVLYLKRYDEIYHYINNRFDMPQKSLSLLLNILNEQKGHLSKRKKQSYFDALTENEVKEIESKYQEVFMLSKKP